jgi:hypothetical protein
MEMAFPLSCSFFFNSLLSVYSARKGSGHLLIPWGRIRKWRRSSPHPLKEDYGEWRWPSLSSLSSYLNLSASFSLSCEGRRSPPPSPLGRIVRMEVATSISLSFSSELNFSVSFFLS